MPRLIKGQPQKGTTVTGPAAFGDSAVVGVSKKYSPVDHSHGLPAAPASVSVGGGDYGWTYPNNLQPDATHSIHSLYAPGRYETLLSLSRLDADRDYFIPIPLLGLTALFSKWFMMIAGGSSAGGEARIAIYEAGNDSTPGALVFQAGPYAMAGFSGILQDTMNVTLTGGKKYYFSYCGWNGGSGVNWQPAGWSYRRYQSWLGVMGDTDPAIWSPIAGFKASRSYAVYPDPYPRPPTLPSPNLFEDAPSIALQR